MKTKKIISSFGLLLAMGTASAVFTSCGGDDPGHPVTDIWLSSTPLKLFIGESATLVATVLPDYADDKTVTWSSSDNAKATVDANGKVTAVALGNVTITAQAGDKTATCEVEVIPEIEMVTIVGGITTLNGIEVTIRSFQIGKYEVTQKQWQDVMGSNPSYFKGDNLPVEMVTHNKIQDFLTALNAKTGKSYHLPTEAEWEYAAKGGQSTHNYVYSGSNTLGDVAWYGDNSDGTTHAVGTKASNELDICDMSGNVREWCSDWYGYSYPSGTDNPTGAVSSDDFGRVVRGGSWNSATGSVSFRGAGGIGIPPDFGNYDIGFRLVLPL